MVQQRDNLKAIKTKIQLDLWFLAMSVKKNLMSIIKLSKSQQVSGESFSLPINFKTTSYTITQQPHLVH
jgi:hypothetical protein